MLSRRQATPGSVGFASIKEVIDGKFHTGSLIHIAGVVTDFRAPIATRGTDWKCQMRIYDHSVQDENDASVSFNIFWPEADMPDARCGDVIIVFSAKLQNYQSAYSLCTHKTTDIYIFDAARIPRPVTDASRALRPSTRSQTSRRLSRAESEHVSVLYSAINKERLPTASKFEALKSNSTKLKDKFSELKDLQDGKFVDTVAQVVREPYDLGDKITLWVSDYTENPLFYQHQLMGSKGKHTYDPYGYTTMSGASTSRSGWSGPLGKLSIQITCYEPHASAIRDERIMQGTWVFLRNLQVKYGQNMANLEGFLREDRFAGGVKINISKEESLDGERTRVEVKNALRRKQQYEKTKKTQIKELTEAAAAGAKRRAELCLDREQPASKKTARERRSQKRALKAQEHKAQQVKNVDVDSDNKDVPSDVPKYLNTHVKCENGGIPPTLIADVLAPVQHEVIGNGGEITHLSLPFINANYRTFVRVIDFMPTKLEDFARPKKVPSEYAALSDHEESDSDSDSDSDVASGSDIESDDTPIDIKQWEWRFYLRLQEANTPGDANPKKSLWAVVDNLSAQMLLNIDATDLRHDDATLGRLRQRMFILWGDLEEHKAQAQNRTLQTKPYTKVGPPADSDDEAEDAVEQESVVHAVSNRPFGCCIRQYGVRQNARRVEEDSGGPAPWQRMFGLFGTRISSV
ncbi:hypothetical protein E4U09_003808 [Claviceps aff. purpurea]|uniref:Protection of telomeres protein 1 n=1 Tax=Claviceps aff. purpurea TaxID=1967640 RepID=A0A9P7QE02_9HYPO|nr:hypothetical protein E4U09_003808 [Claviceps aff. purpurea]